MNIVVALWKGFFILMMTVLRRGLSKRCKVNYLDASTHVSPSLSSILPPRIFRQSNQIATARHAPGVWHSHLWCVHKDTGAINMHLPPGLCVSVKAWLIAPLSYHPYVSSGGIVFRLHHLLSRIIRPQWRSPCMKYGFMSLSRAPWWHGFISQDLYFSPRDLWRLSDGCRVPKVC